MAAARKVLLVGWDGADWRTIQPLIDAGAMPTLARLVRGGASGALATLEPALSPMLWTSVATGKRADQHGILGFVEPTPDGQGVRPVTSTSRRVQALWNMATQAGLRSSVVAWFGGHPAEPIEGAIVTERFHRAPARYGQLWPIPPGTVHPERLEEDLAPLRVHAGDLDPGALQPFLPRGLPERLERGARVHALLRILAECATVHATATHLLEHEPWDLFAVYYDAIDHLGHGFMRFHPPRMDGVTDDEHEAFRDVIAAGYRFHDRMLARLLDLAGPEAALVLVSDHGFHSDHLRPRAGERREAVVNASWHRRHGILLLHGPGVRPGTRVHGANLLDVAPTVLTLLGQPVGDDMEGRPLAEALDGCEVRRIPSWEAVGGPHGAHPEESRQDPWEAEEALRQLVDLGYLEARSEPVGAAVARARRDARYNLAAVHLDAGRVDEAERLLAELYAEDPADIFVALRLAAALLHSGARERAEEVVESALARLEGRPPAQLLSIRGQLALARGDGAAAAEALAEALRLDPALWRAATWLGRAEIAAGRFAEAERAFAQALAADDHDHEAWHGLALARHALGRHEEAVEAALRATEVEYRFAPAHLALGEALEALGRADLARAAIDAAIRLDPRGPRAAAARERLAVLGVGGQAG